MRLKKKIKIQLNGSTFFIPDEKSYQKLHSKGFGYELTNGMYALLPYEAVYLLEKGKVEVYQGKKELTIEDLFRKREIHCDEYLVYKDLSAKGYGVKSGLKFGFSFRVYKKDKRKATNPHAVWLVKVIHDYESISAKEFASAGRIAHSTKKKVLLAIVDSEKSITYYESEWTKL